MDCCNTNTTSQPTSTRSSSSSSSSSAAAAAAAAALFWNHPSFSSNPQMRPDVVASDIWFFPGHERTAHELSTLPSHEREKVWADLSGENWPKSTTSQPSSDATGTSPSNSNSNSFEEDPIMVQDALQALDQELRQRITTARTTTNNSNTNATTTAAAAAAAVDNDPSAFPSSSSSSSTSSSSLLLLVQQTSPEYINTTSFRLQFLRADRFHIQKAVDRIERYFEMKAWLFGTDRIGRDIYFTDLNDNDLKFLFSGGFQILDTPDHAGRGVVYSRPSLFQYDNLQSMLRILWYLVCALVKDENIQKRGVISLHDFVEYETPRDRHRVDFDSFRVGAKVAQALPVKRVAVYACASHKTNGQWNQLIDLMFLLLDKMLRLRARVISGTIQECLYKLMCLGISPDSYPVSPKGKVLLERHEQWIARLRAKEEESSQKQGMAASKRRKHHLT